MGEAGVADFFIGGTLFFTLLLPEAAPALGEALLLDVFLASPANPLAGFENGLGILSFISTAGVDLLEGNTRLSNGSLFIGNDTIVAGRNAALGSIPESNVDFVVNASQIKYDMARLRGEKPGGSTEISISNIDGVVGQLLWYDSPLQDIVNYLVSWKTNMGLP